VDADISFSFCAAESWLKHVLHGLSYYYVRQRVSATRSYQSEWPTGRYYLRSPHSVYRTFFQETWLQYRLIHVIIVTAETQPEISHEEFMQRLRYYDQVTGLYATSQEIMGRTLAHYDFEVQSQVCSTKFNFIYLLFQVPSLTDDLAVHFWWNQSTLGHYDTWALHKIENLPYALLFPTWVSGQPLSLSEPSSPAIKLTQGNQI